MLRLTVKMQLFTIRIMLGLLAISAVTADAVANLIDCHAARMYTMDRHQIENAMREVQEGMSRNLDPKGVNPISGDRRLWWNDMNWHNPAQAYDHCKKACLLPALSYGFDAAVCRLGTFRDHYQFAIGYTPALYLCHSSTPQALGDSCVQTLKIPMPEEKVKIALQNYDAGLADLKDVWTATKNDPKGIAWTKWVSKEPQVEKLPPMINDDYRYVGVTWGGFWDYLKIAFEKMYKMFPNKPVICVVGEKCAMKKGSS